ncbi:MAG: LuxR C-terminal-related transcriptional regulator [Thermaerobacter sp.]|nr:LuxR C-terminal-related transcriptional regulator [Thermaerobacter sp.]
MLEGSGDVALGALSLDGAGGENTVAVVVITARGLDHEGLCGILGEIAGFRCVERETLNHLAGPAVIVVASLSQQWAWEQVNAWRHRGALVVVTETAEPWHIARLMGAGAQAVLDYGDPVARIAATIQGVAWQSRTASPGLVAKWESGVQPNNPESRHLTPLDMQIWEGLAQGRSNAEIAESLGMPSSVIRERVSRIFRELGVHHRTAAAAAWWYEQRPDNGS